MPERMALSEQLLARMLDDGDRERLRIVHVNHNSLSTTMFSQALRSVGVATTEILVDYSRRASRFNHELDDQIVAAVTSTRAADPDKRVVLIEDGGHGTDAVTGARLPVSFSVEQTMRGHRRSARLAGSGRLRHAVISVARSTVKTRLEAPVLAVRIADELSSHMSMAGTSLLGASVRLIGFGILGRAVAWRLRGCYHADVTVVERQASVRETARLEGFKLAQPDDWQSVKSTPLVVIGATGTDLFRGQVPIDALPREVVLCSVSSGDVEFRSLQAFLEHASVKRSRGAFGIDYGLADGRRVVLLADGRPINFFRPAGVSLPLAFGDLLFARMPDALVLGLRAADHLEPIVYKAGTGTADSLIGDDELVAEWRRAYGLDDAFTWPPIGPHVVIEALSAADRHLGRELARPPSQG
jgi:S-adenosylhomocysteine hydrolase